MCRAGAVLEISAPSSQFCCEPKTDLKKVSLGKIKQILYFDANCIIFPL